MNNLTLADWAVFARFVDDHSMEPTNEEQQIIENIGMYENPDYCVYAIYNHRTPDHSIHYDEDKDATYLDDEFLHEGSFLRLSEDPGYIHEEDDAVESIMISTHLLMFVTQTMPDSFYEEYDADMITEVEMIDIFNQFEQEVSNRS